MHRYSGLAKEHFLNPRNVGDVTGLSVIGRAGSFTCGAAVRVSLRIDETQRIADAGFRAAGCGFLVASASFLTEQIKGKTTGEAAALAQSPATAVRECLGDLPADRNHCAALACQAVIAAIKSYSDSARDEWSGDEALICTCFCVSERTIEDAIEQQKLRTIAEVTKACNAGAGCRSCYSLIEDILDDCHRSKC
ncbi:MAG TPA: iron-sulfur cluster assembly scaffold protein [Pyrinomonadaceae bacterium]|nr:iron-sulfur cluster assembly scaffold protein [Pyrinomonadaceae bacterium]